MERFRQELSEDSHQLILKCKLDLEQKHQIQVARDRANLEHREALTSQREALASQSEALESQKLATAKELTEQQAIQRRDQLIQIETDRAMAQEVNRQQEREAADRSKLAAGLMDKEISWIMQKEKEKTESHKAEKIQDQRSHTAPEAVGTGGIYHKHHPSEQN